MERNQHSLVALTVMPQEGSGCNFPQSHLAVKSRRSMKRAQGRQDLRKRERLESPCSFILFSGFNLDVTEENYKQDPPLSI